MDATFADSLTLDANAFLVGCFVPAHAHRERRLRVAGGVCPELVYGITTALNWLRFWGAQPTPHDITIEADHSARYPWPSPRSARAPVFLSGCIDSLACLRANRLTYPLDHPHGFKDALVVYGQNWESDSRPAPFATAVEALSEVAFDAGVTLVPIYTNIRDLDPTPDLFLYKSHGALLASVGHALSSRLTTVSIGSTGYDLPTLLSLNERAGTHPVLGVHYSSRTLRIHHDDIGLSRLQKTRLLADWDVGLRNIRVCGKAWPGTNCGECEKCLRTMLALLVSNALHRSPMFQRVELTPKVLREHLKLGYLSFPFYAELVAPLREIGRADLAKVVENSIARYKLDGRFRRSIKAFDRDFLNGAIRGLKNRLTVSLRSPIVVRHTP